MNKDIYTDMCFDIETLGNSGKFVVLSIAFVPFSILSKFIGEGKIFKISVEDSIKNGFVVNKSTMLWWLEQDTNILKDLLNTDNSIKTVCDEIKSYLSNFSINRFWASATMDYQGIENLFSFCNMPNPITYDKRLCLRTIRELYKFKKEYIHPKYNHFPIDDCKIEIQELFDQLHFFNNNFI